MMNAMEKLAREIMRVTAIRSRFEALRAMPNVMVEPQISWQTNSLEHACVAAGSNDPNMVLLALEDLGAYGD